MTDAICAVPFVQRYLRSAVCTALSAQCRLRSDFCEQGATNGGKTAGTGRKLEHVEDRVHRAHKVRSARIGSGIALALRDEVR